MDQNTTSTTDIPPPTTTSSTATLPTMDAPGLPPDSMSIEGDPTSLKRKPNMLEDDNPADKKKPKLTSQEDEEEKSENKKLNKIEMRKKVHKKAVLIISNLGSERENHYVFSLYHHHFLTLILNNSANKGIIKNMVSQLHFPSTFN
eukprot:CAMPEP_0174274152 /NCGR_PEP_ID=MMETSP0439-20130205/57070_1 /TAXON_ID=0 /ORGANISM="Stereomyxa ramosa, Strain Chinc5" /LENGTH=145 /DNA_ID=CAMNT_0015365765 /DNA_START=14 /DNA_END=451 /DNA_ORIENTATION=-